MKLVCYLSLHFSSLSSYDLSFSLVVSSIFAPSDHLSERVIMELQTRRNRKMPKDEEQMDRGLDMERDDGGNGAQALDEEAQ